MHLFFLQIFRLTKLLLVEQLREPLGIFWTIIAPPLLFSFLNHGFLQQGIPTIEWYISVSSWYMSYICITVSLYGFCLYLIGRREAGFIKSFVVEKKILLIFICSQMLCATLIALISYAFYIISTCLISDIDIFTVAPILILPFLVALFVTMCGSLIILIFPITFQNASSGISIFSALIVILSIANRQFDEKSIVVIINQFNPILIWSDYINQFQAFQLPQILMTVLSLIFGLLGYIMFRTKPVWNRQ